jgi:hypothetical protein
LPLVYPRRSPRTPLIRRGVPVSLRSSLSLFAVRKKTHFSAAAASRSRLSRPAQPGTAAFSLRHSNLSRKRYQRYCGASSPSNRYFAFSSRPFLFLISLHLAALSPLMGAPYGAQQRSDSSWKGQHQLFFPSRTRSKRSPSPTPHSGGSHQPSRLPCSRANLACPPSGRPVFPRSG